MAEPYIGEIRIVGFNFAPRGYAQCNGQLINISQNTALFSILGTTYGGNGTTNFGLPNLQGRAPLSQGSGPGLTPRQLGESSGSANVTVTTQQMPAHTHVVSGVNAAGNQTSPIGGVWATGNARPAPSLYSTTAPDTTMSPAAVSLTGGNQAHNNMSPYLVLNFVIALVGAFPSRN